MTLSEFVQQSLAEQASDDLWTVFVDGANRMGAINNCYGRTEYEAKEDAYQFYTALEQQVKRDQ